MEITQFGASLPPLASSVYQDHLSANDIELVSVHTLLHASTIHLHRDLIMMHPASYQRCLVAANAITSMIRELNDGDYSFLNPIISVRNPHIGYPLLALTRLACSHAGKVHVRSTSRSSRCSRPACYNLYWMQLTISSTRSSMHSSSSAECSPSQVGDFGASSCDR